MLISSSSSLRSWCPRESYSFRSGFLCPGVLPHSPSWVPHRDCLIRGTCPAMFTSCFKSFAAVCDQGFTVCAYVWISKDALLLSNRPHKMLNCRLHLSTQEGHAMEILFEQSLVENRRTVSFPYCGRLCFPHWAMFSFWPFLWASVMAGTS